MKTCLGPCGRSLPLEEFYAQSNSAGRHSRCKKCHNALCAENARKPERRLRNYVAKRRWIARHVEQVAQYQRDYLRKASPAKLRIYRGRAILLHFPAPSLLHQIETALAELNHLIDHRRKNP